MITSLNSQDTGHGSAGYFRKSENKPQYTMYFSLQKYIQYLSFLYLNNTRAVRLLRSERYCKYLYRKPRYIYRGRTDTLVC